MRRMIDYADDLEKIAQYVHQEGSTTEVGGSMEIDGHLMVNGKGMDQAEYTYKYYVEYLNLEYNVHSSEVITIDVHMQTSPFIFYSNTQMTQANAEQMILAAAQDLALVGAAQLQQISSGTATVTRYGMFATHTENVSVMLVDGTTISAMNYDYDDLDIAYDCRNLTEGITYTKTHD